MKKSKKQSGFSGWNIAMAATHALPNVNKIFPEPEPLRASDIIPADKLKDALMQRDIAVRANRSMLILNIALRRRTGRPIGRHLDLRPDKNIQEMAHMR